MYGREHGPFTPNTHAMTIIAPRIAQALAPSGVLRAGINLSNFLLVTSRGPAGEPQGVAPDMAAHLAKALGVPLELVPYKNPGLLADAAVSGGDAPAVLLCTQPCVLTTSASRVAWPGA